MDIGYSFLKFRGTSRVNILQLSQRNEGDLKKYLFLGATVISFLLSFFVHRYFIQLIVMAVFFGVLFIIYKNSEEMEILKKTIEGHNELIKEDIGLLKKEKSLN